MFFFSETFQIKEVIISGEEKVSKDELKSLIEEKLEKEILFVKTRSIFLANLNEIKKDILNNFPQISEIEIRRGLPNSLNVVAAKRLGTAIWCQKDNCFLLDNKGVIFEEFSGETDSPKIIDRRNIDAFSLGEKVIDEKRLEQILEIESKIIKDLKIAIPAVSRITDERLDINTFEGWEIYFNLTEDVSWQLQKLSLVLEKEIPPENRGNLEYIDLRFTRVYYKYR